MLVAVERSVTAGPGWLAIPTPGGQRIQIRTSPDVATHGLAPEFTAIEALLTLSEQLTWDCEFAYVDERGWDVWILAKVTTS